MDCIFCKIGAKQLPSHIVYEDTHAVAFLDIHPHAKGHTVVIPRVHVENLLDLNEQLYHDFLVAVKKTMERISVVLHPDGFTIGWNHGEAGGQVVPHLHVHIFPRYEGDGGSSMHGVINNPSEVSVADIAQMFV